MDKNCEKIHYIAPNIYCCGAGTAADTENTTGKLSKLQYLSSLLTLLHSSFDFIPIGASSIGIACL